MKYYIKQKFFTFFDTFDIYDESGQCCYKVKNQCLLIHQFEFVNLKTNKTYQIEESFFKLFNKFKIKNSNNELLDTAVQEISFLKYVINYEKSGWKLQSSWPAISFTCKDKRDNLIFSVEKAIFSFTDYYEVEVLDIDNSDMAIIMMICMDALMCRN